MKAAFYSAFQGPVTIERLPDPAPPPNGVVIAVKATGLCLSDWHGWMGHDKDIVLPHVPGHELAGEIIAIGKEVKNWNIGQRVTLPFVCGCGTCPTCTGGDPQVCPDQFQPGFTHWGSFAEYVSIHYADANLVAIPPGISDVTAASLGCRFATSFRGVVDQGRVKEGEWVAVYGCGGVGLSAIMIAVASGARVIAIDQKQEALVQAKKLGAEHTILSEKNEDIFERVVDLTQGGVHLTIDAIGNQEVIRQAIFSLKRRGRHIQIGILPPDQVHAKLPTDRFIAYELEYIGSHGMAAARYPDMIRWIEEGKLQPQLIVSQTISLQEGIDALPVLHQSAGTGINVITSF